MSKTVDERVVSMRFDNQQFERGVRQTSDSLERFKEKFNFRQQETEFDRLQGLVNTFSLTHMASELSNLGDRFGLFGTIAGRALENITDKAMSTVSNLINQLGIGFGGIKDGFEEYEVKMKSVQVMLSQLGADADDPFVGIADSMEESGKRISGSLKEMATLVVRGNYGNGLDRVKALGEAYQQIQDAVNEAWAAGGKVPEGWERGLETLSDTAMIAGEKVSESSEVAAEGVETNMQHITKILDELNGYADKTVYTFSDMTSAIGTFMTAGIDIDTATKDVQGLSNLAADVGATNEDLKRSMFQLSQGLSSGTIRLQDWMSVERTAGMGGKKFQEAIKQTAREHGIAIDEMIEAEGSFRNTLKKNWFTADIFNETVNKFTHKGLIDYLVQHSTLTEEDTRALIKNYESEKQVIENTEELSEALAKNSDLTAETIDNYLKQERRMTKAATEVRTATQLIGVIRESIGSGWATTFEQIIGDEQEATELFTGINDRIGEFIGKIADTRNQLLQEWKTAGGRNTLIEALGKIFDFTDADSILYNLIKPIKDALLEVFNLEGFDSSTLVNATNKFKAIVDNVAKFIKDHYEEIKGIVKLVAVYFRLKFNMFMAKVKLVLFLLKLFSPVLKVIFEVVGRVAGALGNLLNQSSGISGIISGMTDAFNGLGNSLSSISGIKLPDLSGFTDKLGLGSINLSGLGTVGDTISQFVGGIAGAGQNVDTAKETVEDTQQLLEDTKDISNELNETSKDSFARAKKNAELRQRYTEEELEQIEDYIKSRDDLLSKLKGDDWFSNILPVAGIAAKQLGIQEKVISDNGSAVSKMMSTASKIMKKTVKSKIDPALVKKAASKLKQQKETIKDFGQALADFFYIDTEALKKTLNLPEKGGFWVILGRIKDWFAANYDNILNLIKTILAYKAVNSLVAAIGGLAKISESIAYAAGAMGRMFDSVGHAVRSAAKSLKMKAIGEMFRDLAIGVGILVGAVAGLSALNPERLWPAVGALAAIVAIFLAMSYAASKISAIDTPKIAAIALFMTTFGISIAILAAALKSLAKLDEDQIKQGLGGIAITIAGIIAAAKILEMGPDKTLNKVAGTLLALSVSILLLSAAVKSFAKMSGETFVSGIIRVALSLVVFTKAMKSIQSSAKENTKSAGTLIALSVSLLLLGSAIKKFSKMDPEQFYRGLVRIALGLLVLVGAVSLLNKGANTTVFDKGQKAFNPIMKTLLGMSAAMLVLSLVIKMISSIPIDKALPAVGMLGGIMLEFAYLSKTMIESAKYMNSGKGVAKVLLGFAFSLLIISLIVKIIGSMPIAQAIKGVVLISALMWEMVGAYTVIAGVGDIAKKSMGPMIMVAITMAILGFVVSMLSRTNTAQAFSAVGELGVLLGSLAAVMFAIAESTKIVKKGDLVAGAALFFFLAIIGAALGQVITVCSNEIQNPVAAIALAGSIAMLIGAMAGVLIAIAGATKIGINEAEIKDVGALLAVLSIVVIALAGTISYFSEITNASTVIPLATAVSELLLAMIPVFAAVAKIAKSTVGISKLQILAVGAVFDALAALFTFSLAAVLAAIGAIPWNNAIDNGLEILKNIGKKLGEAIGGFIEAISIGMLNAAKNIAEGLEAVFSQITGLVDSLHGKVDDNSVELIKQVIKLIATMTAADFIDALTSWFTMKITGGKKSNIADRIKDLGVGIAGLQTSMNGVDYYKLKELVGVFDSIAKVLAAISAVILSSAYSDLMDFFTGGKKKDSAMKELSDGLKEFVQNGFISSIRILNEQIPDYKTDTVTKKVEMLGTFAEALKPLQQIMPRTTSIVSVIVGQADNDWGKLGESLSEFIKHMTSAVMIITADVTVDADGNQVKAPNDAKFDAAAKRLQTISGFSNSFSAFDTIRGNTPSLKGFIFGDKMDWGDFGRSLSAFICAMSSAVHTLTDDVIGDDAGNTVAKPDEAKFTEAGKRLNIIQGFTTTFKEYAGLMPQPVEVETAFGKFKIGTDWTTFGHDLENFVGSLVEIVRVMNQEHLVGFDLKIGIAVRRFTDIGELTSTLKKFSEVQIPSDGFLKTFHQLVTGEGGWTLFGEDLAKFMPNLISAIKILATDDGWYGKDEDRPMSVDELIDQAVKRAGKLERLGKALSLYADFVVTMAGKGETITQAITKHDPIAALSGTPLLQEDTRADQTILQRTGSTLENFFTGVIQIAKTIADNGEFIDKFIDEGQAPERLDKLSSIADPLKNFINAFVDIDAEGGETAGKNIKSILEAFSTPLADNEVSGLESFATSFTSFIEQLKVLGTLVELDKYEGKIDKSISLLERVSKIRFTKNSLQISELGSALYTIGQGIRNFSTFVNDPEVDKATQSGIYNTVTTFISDLNTSLATGNPTFDQTGKDYHTSLLNGLSTNLDIDFKEAINKAVDFVTNGSDNGWKSLWVEAFESLGKQLAAGLARGMEDSGALENIANAAVKMVNEAKNATETAAKIESPSKVMASLGKYIPLGFAEGIKDKSSLRSVTDASVKMAKTVETATKEYLEIHSPSKVMYKLGAYTVKGFVDGMKDEAGGVGEVAKTMAGTVAAIGKDLPDYSVSFKDEPYIATALALKGLTVGTVEYEEAASKAAAANIKFATSLYAATDEYKSDKEEVTKLTEELKKLREEEEKASNKRSEAIAKAESETGKAAEYMQSKWDKANEAIASIGGVAATGISDNLNAYMRALDIYENMEDGIDKLAYKETVDSYKKALDNLIDSLDDSTDAAKEQKEALKSVIDALVNARSESNNLVKGFKDDAKEAEETFKDSADAVMDKEDELAKKNQEMFDKIVNQWKEYIKNIKDAVKQYTNIFSGTAASIDLFAEREKPQELQLTEHEAMESRADAEQELADAQRDLAKAQAQSDAVQGKSLIALKKIEDANNRIAEAKQRIQEIDERNAEITKRNAEIDAENARKQYEQTAEYAAEEMMANMQAALQKYQDYKANVELIEQIDFEGPAKEYIKELVRGGYSNADQIAKIVRASMSNLGSEFVKTFNASYVELSQDESESYRKSIEDKMAKTQEWSQKIAALRENHLNENLINEIIDQGPDNSQLVDMIYKDLQTDGNQAIIHWNNLYGDIETNANNIANTITATVSGLADVLGVSATAIIQAIMQANAGNVQLSVYGEQLRNILASNAELSKLYRETYLGNINNWTPDMDVTRVVYASKLAAEAVNEEINRLNKESNGLFAIQNGLINYQELTQPITEAITTSLLPLTEKTESTVVAPVGSSSVPVVDALKTITETGAVKESAEALKQNNQTVLDFLTAVTEFITYKKEFDSLFTEWKTKFDEFVTNDNVHFETRQKFLQEYLQLIANYMLRAADVIQQAIQIAANMVSTAVLNAMRTLANEVMRERARADAAEAQVESLRQQIAAMSSAMVSGIRAGLGIHSPSTEFEKIGKYINLGLAKGLNETSDIVNRAMPILDLSASRRQAQALDFGTTRRLASGISPNAVSKLDEAIRSLAAAKQEPASNNDYSTQNNTFNITGSDPREIANQVNVILQKKAVRRRESWA